MQTFNIRVGHSKVTAEFIKYLLSAALDDPDHLLHCKARDIVVTEVVGVKEESCD